MLHYSPLEVTLQRDLRDLLEELYQEKTLHPFRAGQPIPLQDNQVWIVCRGVVQLNTFYANGEEALLGLASPSMPFGLPLTLIHPYQAIALSDVDLMPLAIAEIEQSPVLSQSIFRQLNRRLRQTEALLALAGHRRVEERLRQLLLLLQEEVGQPVPQGTRLGVRLTHQHLASAIGTTRVTVTRLLGQFRQDGWLTIDRSRHLVLTSKPVA
ncbi:Crp/Fnr family transcriptional regulator [Geitlerinema sp. PCC 7407]|uniref:Crp/Fnr family transcriptional regulator n=1 Tax=Geitlerinema sp. PCC 7407 TaxID=1173025 RepID=UPI00029F9B02|nr:Crp/Fnr family transcriptional regulator [Geitlerinema sp. PCC 7407]AFY65702.1 transcriptional regulator, Crp/Fnr family [Geitlerinema sp. PCC 7407]